MILDRRIAALAEEDIKAKGQAGFRKDFRTTDNVFDLESLTDNILLIARMYSSTVSFCSQGLQEPKSHLQI